MIKKLFICLFVFLNTLIVKAQTPQVPNTMEFGGIELKIDKNAQELIQASVNALTRHPKSFQILVDRANIHFPLIERILKEEGVPEDFKYLVLQESSLIPDAVSTSNAVGYWQFKKEAASDVNVLVNSHVDERMHIVSATRGAAKYVKKNNIYLNNWLNALLSYYAGLGGVKVLIDPGDNNASSMKITRSTHIYVLKFLSYKVAFENALKLTPPHYTLLEYKDCKNKSLKEVADELDLSEEDLAKYNVWLKTKKVPSDRPYSVVIPASESNYEKLLALTGSSQPAPQLVAQETKTPVTTENLISKLTTVNDLKAVIAGEKDNLQTLSKKGKISEKRFLKYNELQKGERIIPGQVYYLELKKNKAEKDYHVAEESETFWSISQKYGIKNAKLLRYNRISRNEKLQVGRVLWIAETRPVLVPVEIKVTKSVAKQAEVKVISYPDKRPAFSNKNSESSDESDMFPDNFYEDIESTPVSSSAVSNTSAPTNTVSSAVPPAPVYPDVKNSEISNTEGVHKVKKGETLYSISKQYEVSVSELKEMNNLGDSGLQPGQELVIKKAISSTVKLESFKKENYITYIVESGDTFYKIAKQHNVSIKQLQEWNNKSDHSISIGEQLKIFRN